MRDSPIKQYSFSSHFLRVAIGAVATAVLLLGGYALAVGLDGYSRVRTSRLETRNQALRTEFEQFQRRIELLESTLDDVAANDARFRGIAGLESIDPEVLRAGVGGPGLGSDPVDPSHRGLEEQLVTTRPSRLGTLPQGRDGRRVAPPADSMASSFYYTRSRGGGLKGCFALPVRLVVGALYGDVHSRKHLATVIDLVIARIRERAYAGRRRSGLGAAC